MRRRQGFTLIELMIAVAILGIVSVYMFESFAVNQRAYTTIDQISESQQSLRAIADLLERDVRHAGLMLPEGAAVCGIDATGAPDRFYVSDANAIDPDDDLATYSGSTLIGVTQVSAGATTFTLSSLVMEPAPARPAYDSNLDGSADADFQLDGGAILMDLTNPGRGTACGRVTQVNLVASQLRIDLQTGALAVAGAGAQLVVVPAHEYRIANGDQLLRDGKLLAEGVEDLQVAYFLDADNDNVIDPGEVRGDGVGANYAAAGLDHSRLREVRVNLVTRTRAQDPTWSEGQFQTRENRAAVAGTDGFRRRVYTSTVMVRNLGARILL